MDEGSQEPIWGGSRTGAGAKSKWKTGGKTKLLRIPEAIANEVLEAARAIDAGKRLVAAQRKRSTAPKAPKIIRGSHWLEKYTLKRCNKEYSYYRYCWINGGRGAKRTVRHIPGGQATSEACQKNVALVREAMAQGLPRQEILQLINSMPEAKTQSPNLPNAAIAETYQSTAESALQP